MAFGVVLLQPETSAARTVESGKMPNAAVTAAGSTEPKHALRLQK
jgi:hypothetical protein